MWRWLGRQRENPTSVEDRAKVASQNRARAWARARARPGDSPTSHVLCDGVLVATQFPCSLLADIRERGVCARGCGSFSRPCRHRSREFRRPELHAARQPPQAQSHVEAASEQPIPPPRKLAMTRAAKVALVLLVLLTALRGQANVSPCEKAQAQLETLSAQLELYRASEGSYPPRGTLDRCAQTKGADGPQGDRSGSVGPPP
jgi:hypothetical protein